MRIVFKTISGIILALLATTSGGAEPEELSCASHGAAPAAINECLTNALGASQKKLAVSIKALVKTVIVVQSFQSNEQHVVVDATVKKLINAQQAWEGFREQHCAFTSALVGPVGDAQQEKIVCRLRMTRARDAELHEEMQFWREKYPRLEFK